MSWINLTRGIRLWIYRLLSVPFDARDTAHIFRFGLPFILKITHRLESTEADACYALFTGYISGDELVEALPPKYGDVRSILEADPLVFTHTDLRMQNVLLTPDLHLSGIIDWEDAGWLPMERQWSFLAGQRPLLTCISYCQYSADIDVEEQTRKAYEVVLAAGGKPSSSA